jgi:hypothetical protein
MTRLPQPNEGDRPSRLQLARYHTGELEGAERTELETWLADHPEGQAFLDTLEAARAEVTPLDAKALRRRAAQLPDEVPETPQPANRPLPWRLLIPLLAAALALLLVLPVVLSPDQVVVDDPDVIRIKGDEALVVYQLKSSGLVPYDGKALGSGDVLGFRVNPAGHGEVVLMSVDGAGTVTVFYPVEGETVQELPAEATDVPLPLTVTLDGAPGPEVFVAVFDTTPSQARDEAERTWQAGGAEAVMAWAQRNPADAVVVERR